MNKTFSIVLASSVVAMTCAAATPEEKAAKERERAAQKASVDAWNALRKKASDLARTDFKGGFANYWHDHIDAARALYESALTNDVFRNAQKIAAIREAAQCRLEATRDEKGALETLELAFILKDLTDDDRKLAEKNRHEMRVLMRLEEKNAEELKKEAKRDAAYFAQAFANPDPKRGIESRLVSEYAEYLGNLGYDAFAELPAKVKELEAKYEKPNYRAAVMGYATVWWQKKRPAKAVRDARFPALIVALADGAPEGRGISDVALFGYLNGRKGYEARTAELAAKVVEQAAQPEPKGRDARRVADTAKKVLAYKDVKGDPARAIKACRAYLAAEGKADDKVELAKQLSEQARAFLKAGDEKGALAIWNERTKIVPVKDVSKLSVPWWSDAPHDIRGIVQSDFYRKSDKGLLSHKYGDNLKFLIETDSAILGREMTTDKGEKFRPTELFAFCDAQGVKILLRAYLDNMAAVRAGFASVPGYETYLATGIDDPYHCLMFDPKEGGKMGDSFTTQYDNGTGYRNLRSAKGSISYDNLYLDDSAATLVSIPWAAVWTSIPSKSPTWYFEAINWAHGGLSFGGSISVHHRSSFGELTFAGITPEALAAIKRTILLTAKSVLGRATSARTNGFAEKWSDPELGDQEFYLAEVKPLVERLKSYLDRVSDKLTDAEVNEIYDNAAEDALNIDYVIARLRTKWLERTLTK